MLDELKAATDVGGAGAKDWLDSGAGVGTRLRSLDATNRMQPGPPLAKNAPSAIRNQMLAEAISPEAVIRMMESGPGQVAMGFLGNIRAGGNPFLQATHVPGSPWELFNKRTLEKGGNPTPLRELSSPSFAISEHGSDIPFHVPGTAIVVPRTGALDPLSHPSTLYNRDAYAYRGAHMADALNDPLQRVEQRFNLKDQRMRESGFPKSTGDVAHDLAVLNSPRFPSFKAYENSTAGARTLSASDSPEDWASRYVQELMEWRGANNGRRLRFDELQPALQDAAKRQDVMAQELLRGAKQAPSDYAELKTRGPLALTPEKIAGVILPEPTGLQADAIDILKKEYAKRGLPVHNYTGEDIPDLRRIIDEIQRSSQPFGGG